MSDVYKVVLENNLEQELPAPEVTTRLAALFQPAESVERFALDESAMDSGMAEESMFEHHLYTLGRPTTIAVAQ